MVCVACCRTETMLCHMGLDGSFTSAPFPSPQYPGGPHGHTPTSTTAPSFTPIEMKPLIHYMNYKPFTPAPFPSPQYPRGPHGHTPRQPGVRRGVRHRPGCPVARPPLPNPDHRHQAPGSPDPNRGCTEVEPSPRLASPGPASPVRTCHRQEQECAPLHPRAR